MLQHTIESPSRYEQKVLFRGTDTHTTRTTNFRQENPVFHGENSPGMFEIFSSETERDDVESIGIHCK